MRGCAASRGNVLCVVTALGDVLCRVASCVCEAVSVFQRCVLFCAAAGAAGALLQRFTSRSRFRMGVKVGENTYIHNSPS